MDKPLPDKEENVTRVENAKGAQDTAVQKNPDDYDPALTEKAFDESTKTALKDTPQGRAVIRAFSRGVLGTAAFAIGGLYAGRSMKNYTPDKKIVFGEQGSWIQYIARFYDVAFGKPLKATANFFGRDGEKFVNNFRSSVYFPSYKTPGRSLGHEVVMVTFDFASMSVGDFWGRKIAHTIDPKSERPKWKREDGSIDWGEAAKSFGHNWWTALTYSAGEDWAVAVPYVMSMRHITTPLVDKMIPGYRYDFDLNNFGGGIKIDKAGKVVGNFTTAGVINLWERFTTYNVGTLLFREAYNYSGNRIKHAWKTGEIPSLIDQDPDHPVRSAPEKLWAATKQFVNWGARGTVKAVTYMIPSVPFFWVTRVPQNKFRGAFINPEKGYLLYMKEGKGMHAVHANTLRREGHPDTRYTDPNFTSETPVYFFKGLDSAGKPKLERTANPFSHGPFDPHAQTWGFVDAALNPVAKGADKFRETARGPIGSVFNFFGHLGEKIRHLFNRPLPEKYAGGDEGANRAGTYIMASMSYTPYFWAKSDWLADKWDYGRMDVAVDRTLKGAAHLNPNEFNAGLDEMWRAIKRQPLKDPVREKYAQCREATDESPSDNKFDVNQYAGQNCNYILKKTPPKIDEPKPELTWQERTISGKKSDIAAHENNPKGHAEREEMRKALEELQPPTNSIN